MSKRQKEALKSAKKQQKAFVKASKDAWKSAPTRGALRARKVTDAELERNLYEDQ